MAQLIGYRKEKSILWALIGAEAFLFFIAITESWHFFAVYGVLVALASAIQPVVGAALWYMPAPFEAVTVVAADFSPYVAITPAFISGSIIHLLVRSHFRLARVPFIIGLSFFTVTLLSATLSSQTPAVRSVISVGLLVSCTVIAIWSVNNYPGHARYIIFGAIISAVGASVFAISQRLGSWRLTMTPTWGGGVRHLDTSVSIALTVTIVVMLFSIESRKRRPIRAGRAVGYFRYQKAIVLFLGAVLVATVSRGSLLAVAVALLLGVLVYSGALLRTGRINKIAVTIVGVFVAIAIFVPIVDAYFAKGHIVSRGLMFLQNPFQNSRWRIWGQALSQLAADDWLFGTHLGGFRGLADTSAHSTYFGALVETGLVGLILMVMSQVILLMKGLAVGGELYWMFSSFYFVSFLTKGSIYNKYYYYSLVVGVALFLTLGQMRGNTAIWGPTLRSRDR